MIQALIASFVVSFLIIGVGCFVVWKAAKNEKTAHNKNEVLKDKKVARWVTMIGFTALMLLPYIATSLWVPVNSMIVLVSTLIAVSLFMIYLTYFVGEKGVAPSYSDSCYWGMGYLFTIVCFLVAISTAVGLFELSEGKWYQFTAFLAATGLGFVGAAPMFKNVGMENKVHSVGAVLCGVSSQVFVVLSGYWFIPALLFSLAFLIIKKYGNRIWWIEMAAFASTFATMELMTFK